MMKLFFVGLVLGFYVVSCMAMQEGKNFGMSIKNAQKEKSAGKADSDYLWMKDPRMLELAIEFVRKVQAFALIKEQERYCKLEAQHEKENKTYQKPVIQREDPEKREKLNGKIKNFLASNQCSSQ